MSQRPPWMTREVQSWW
uniref:Uncharacterized protein n=1 Tax=Arundo donax TaxID=35708 RepID=A0A0A9C964_ARUDO